ncbi:hypothetical protein ACA910_002907 [Epithemia clementina (nom. ined.)]
MPITTLKRPPSLASSNNNSDDAVTSAAVASIVSGPLIKRCKTNALAKKYNDRTHFRQNQQVGHLNLEMDEILNQVHFCCFVCFCSKETKKTYCTPDNNGVFQTTPDCFFHRTCCHKISKVQSNTAAQIDEFLSKNGARIFGVQEGSDDDEKNNPPCIPPVCTFLDIQRWYLVHKRHQEPTLQNETLGNACPISILTSSPEYLQLASHFRKALKRARRIPDHEKPKAVVLDLFSGIGTSIVALKRLSIGIRTIIHVEWDKVATHVYRSNHDPGYNPSLKEVDHGGILHVYYPSFRLFMKDDFGKYGPIDIVVAGPPCTDFSPINASRQGLDGKQGSNMLKTAELVKELKQRKRHLGHRLFYIIENVPIPNKPGIALAEGDRAKICQLLDHPWDPVELDARYFSPCKRKRIFFTNIRLESHRFGDGAAADLTGSDCLEDGFQLPCHIIEPTLKAKANTFMASLTRLDSTLEDDSRMIVVKRQPEQCRSRTGGPSYLFRTFSVEERANMMGYPPGYLAPVNDLFERLSFAMCSNQKYQSSYWRGNIEEDCKDTGIPVLDEKYHQFSGAYHGVSNDFRFALSHENKFMLKLRPPKGAVGMYYSADEYAKRLVGNAFSVPVMEHILQSIRPFFATQRYANFQYEYAWADKLRELEAKRCKQE